MTDPVLAVVERLLQFINKRSGMAAIDSPYYHYFWGGESVANKCEFTFGDIKTVARYIKALREVKVGEAVLAIEKHFNECIESHADEGGSYSQQN